MNRLENCGQRIRTSGYRCGQVAANMRQPTVFIKTVTAPLSVTLALAAATLLLRMRKPTLVAVLSGTLTLLSFKGKDLGVLATAHAISIGRIIVAGYCGRSVRCHSTGTVRSGLGVGGGALCVRVSHASTLPSALAGR